MSESQNVEWKESWHDEYLKWICGFANAQGGKIYIGTEDNGTVVGVKNSKKLMKPHDSVPYNPDIAGVFYLAGYIERWGRGVEKICDACKALGAEPPVYELLGNGLRIHFAALQSALVDNTKAPKLQSSKNTGALEQNLTEQIVEILMLEPNITQGKLAERLGIGRKVLQIKMNSLKETGRIERVGGKRYGYWNVVK